MGLVTTVVLYVSAYVFLGNNQLCDYLLELWDINLLSPFNTQLSTTSLVCFSWVVVASFLALNTSSTSWATTPYLYVLGVNSTILASARGACVLLFSNTVLWAYSSCYYLKRLAQLRSSTQTWTPLFRKGGYITLLNSSRARWQLAKSHNILKNK